MTKTFNIQVDCANCANLMENAAQKVAGVQAAVVNFMTQKITVTFSDNANPQNVMSQVLAACRKIDSDCEIDM